SGVSTQLAADAVPDDVVAVVPPVVEVARPPDDEDDDESPPEHAAARAPRPAAPSRPSARRRVSSPTGRGVGACPSMTTSIAARRQSAARAAAELAGHERGSGARGHHLFL